MNKEKLEISPHVEKILFPHNRHTWKAKNSPHDKFFSTNNISDISDEYEVCLRGADRFVNI